MKKYIALLAWCVLATPINLSAAVIFQDGWETGDMSATNVDGFAWDSNNATSVVTVDPELGDGTCAGTETGNYAIYNNEPKCTGPQSPLDNWAAKTGDMSLRFRYQAGASWSEQRFNTGAPYPELWLSYWIRVPVNYEHTNTDGSGANNKFLSLWMDGYETAGAGSTVWLSMEQSDSNSDLAFTYTTGGNTGSLGMQQYTPFINSSTDRGRWMHIVFYVKSETSPGTANGVIQTYRKWNGDSSYTQLHNATGLAIKRATTPAGFQNGYLLGWANGAYAVDTEWLIDDVTFSTTDLREENAGPSARRLSLAGRLIKLAEPGP